jgi:hypothetical protein
MLTFLKEYSRAILKGNIPAVTSFQYYKRWKHLLGKDPINEKLPWITFKAIDFIKKNTKCTDKVFEYGGGGSTLYFLDRVAEVVTVEHDQEWFRILQRKIDAENSIRWYGQLILPENPSILQIWTGRSRQIFFQMLQSFEMQPLEHIVCSFANSKINILTSY